MGFFYFCFSWLISNLSAKILALRTTSWFYISLSGSISLALCLSLSLINPKALINDVQIEVDDYYLPHEFYSRAEWYFHKLKIMEINRH